MGFRRVIGMVVFAGLLLLLGTNVVHATRLTIVIQGDGWVGDAATVNCHSTCTADYEPGARVVINPFTTDPLTGAPISFGGWLGCDNFYDQSQRDCMVWMTTDRTITVRFGTPLDYNLTVARQGTGGGRVVSAFTSDIDCGATCAIHLPNPSYLDLQAIPDADSLFERWGDPVCSAHSYNYVGNTSLCELATGILPTPSYTVNPVFTHANRLTVSVTGIGIGAVSSSPNGISCPDTCSALFLPGTVVTLTANTGTNSTFAGWSGGGCSGTGACTVTMNAATSVTATFNGPSRVLTLTKSGTGSGTVTSSPAAIDCGPTCSANIALNSTVTLNAVPAPGSAFTGWTGGICSGNGACTVTMDNTRTVNAAFNNGTFKLDFSVTGYASVTSNPAGLSCTAPNSSCSAIFSAGTQVTISAAPYNGQVNPQYINGWTWYEPCAWVGASPTCTLTMDQDYAEALTTLDKKNNTISVLIAGGKGYVSAPGLFMQCPSSCAGDTLGAYTLTASAYSGYVFTGWSGDCTGTGTCTVNNSAGPKTVTANFSKVQPTLTVNLVGISNGLVFSDPAGVSCSSNCTAQFAPGTVVKLMARGPANYSAFFTGWNGGGCSGTGDCTVSLTDNTTVTANFSAVTNPQTLTVTSTARGAVYSSPPVINCGATCSASFSAGSTVTLTAVPSTSYFGGWGGACSGTAYTCTVTMNGPVSVSADFPTYFGATYNLTVVQDANSVVVSEPALINCGAGKTQCTARLLAGQVIKLIPHPWSGVTFDHWTGTPCAGQGSGPCTLTMNGPYSVTPNYVAGASNRLAVKMAGHGTGKVSATSGIDCPATSCVWAGSTVPNITLTATPDSGVTFTGWVGGGCSGTGPCNVVVRGDMTVTAVFDGRFLAGGTTEPRHHVRTAGHNMEPAPTGTVPASNAPAFAADARHKPRRQARKAAPAPQTDSPARPALPATAGEQQHKQKQPRQP